MQRPKMMIFFFKGERKKRLKKIIIQEKEKENEKGNKKKRGEALEAPKVATRENGGAGCSPTAVSLHPPPQETLWRPSLAVRGRLFSLFLSFKLAGVLICDLGVFAFVILFIYLVTYLFIFVCVVCMGREIMRFFTLEIDIVIIYRYFVYFLFRYYFSLIYLFIYCLLRRMFPERFMQHHHCISDNSFIFSFDNN